jgi:hypothetical protein
MHEACSTDGKELFEIAPPNRLTRTKLSFLRIRMSTRHPTFSLVQYTIRSYLAGPYFEVPYRTRTFYYTRIQAHRIASKVIREKGK